MTRTDWNDYDWQLIHEAPQRPALHMALDAVITDEVGAGTRPPTLRIWEWSAPAVVIGRFQSLKNEVDPEGARRHGIEVVRRVSGVADAVQYTRPVKAAVERVRRAERPVLSTREKHTRECFVVLKEGADAGQVRDAIVTMPHYFDAYDTMVHFISAEELARDHRAMGHGGFVIRSGNTSAGNAQVVEYALKLGSNPEFTASVLVAYARAVHRLHAMGQYGAKTVFDVPPGLLSARSAEQLRAEEL